MNKFSPLIKGLITGAVMLIVTLLLFYTHQPANAPLTYLVYILYIAGIGWTLIDYSRSSAYTGKFGELFSQGFRCFIVVALIMVIFTGIFSAAHPEFANEDAKNYKEALINDPKKDKTPNEIDEAVDNLKKHYTTGLVYAAILGYLVLGTIITAAGAGIVLMRRK